MTSQGTLETRGEEGMREGEQGEVGDRDPSRNKGVSRDTGRASDATKEEIVGRRSLELGTSTGGETRSGEAGPSWEQQEYDQKWDFVEGGWDDQKKRVDNASMVLGNQGEHQLNLRVGQQSGMLCRRKNESG
ncbi:uncharacterized protein C8R40DRAFT_1070816 [Lentinula edodes]|uniref:uncharacterized protein n=1 Tax=Lentinula edodes TaxID=5353 RepID=UPI001E8C9DBF|nr:uncharacterized protein C8R40DRAFT_1070816 [Lentinula edodes]KAH7873599.1 hypothetical protein C8R40DRAFT_1070816 [Lentinula edodes]